ncbi:MAG: chromosomal replication initiator protein DnaA [Clostridiales bacterium]|nr:chromosomal replication initiator protein DnaA [Clostridiales bacterium]
MLRAKELWEKMLTCLEIEVSAVNFDVWIKTLEPISIIDGRLVLMAPGSRRFVVDKFSEQLESAMREADPAMTSLLVVGKEDADIYRVKEEAYAVEEQEEIPKVEANVINPKYNFENFVVGKSNQFMYAAARAVADEPGTRYNPLFIYGGAGLGKTHIMHAIGNSVRMSHPHLKVLYASSEKFVNEFIASIRTTKGKSTNFRDKYRNVDVLMIDDIQFIADKAGTQEEMFHTFNDLHQNNKQIILTSDRPPKEISPLEERLRTRFEWGLIVDVQPPDLETRIAILQKKAQAEKCNLPFDVLSLMAEKISDNVRDMESLLNKVIFLSRLYNSVPSLELVGEALKDYTDKTEESVSAERIIECVCRYFSVTREDLTGKKKTKEVVEPRQVCIYMITDMLALPLATIGDMFGGRDHTTVMHARDKIAEKLPVNQKLKVAVADIKDMVLKK